MFFLRYISGCYVKKNNYQWCWTRNAAISRGNNRSRCVTSFVTDWWTCRILVHRWKFYVKRTNRGGVYYDTKYDSWWDIYNYRYSVVGRRWKYSIMYVHLQTNRCCWWWTNDRNMKMNQYFTQKTRKTKDNSWTPFSSYYIIIYIIVLKSLVFMDLFSTYLSKMFLCLRYSAKKIRYIYTVLFAQNYA